MNWETLGSVGDGVGGLAGAAAAIAAAVAIKTSRRDQRLRDASGLHGEMYFQAQELPSDVELPDEPGAWSDAEMVCKVTNSSGHPYYGVVASVFLRSRRERFAARADVIGPTTTLYASMGLVIGCDLAAMDDSVQVVLTFIDSQGRAWRRNETGFLKRVPWWQIWRSSRQDVAVYPGRAATLHGLREVEKVENDGRGVATLELVDGDGCNTTIAVLGPGEDRVDSDKRARPPILLERDKLIGALAIQGWPQQGRRWSLLHRLISVTRRA